MKHTLTLCALMFAASASAQFTGDRIFKIIPITTEKFGILPGMSRLSDELHTNDIDSITFDVDAQTFTVYGGPSYTDNGIKTATYSLDKLIGFEFEYLLDGELPSTCLDLYGHTDRNSFRLKWRPVEGAVGYTIRYGLQSKMTNDWDNNPDILGEVTVGPESTSALIEHLNYNATYRFAIRTLSPWGEGYHSEWSSRINFGLPQWNILNLTTDFRYTVPSVIAKVETGLDEATVKLNTEFKPTEYTAEDADTIRSRFEIVDNHFVVNMLKVLNTQTGKTVEHQITPAETAAGQVKLTGLDNGTRYLVSAYNTNIPWECDAFYHSKEFWTKLDSSIPVHVSSTDLGKVLNTYMNNDAYMPNQIYYLEGGKTYTISTNIYITKGVTIATNPDDLAVGNRAKVEFMPGTTTAPSNFFIGRQQQPDEIPDTINIDSIKFEGIDFSAPEAMNFASATVSGTSSTGSGNYFINNNSNGIPYNLESLEIKNCTFQKFIRGFVRMQGNGHNIAKINVDNNVFYNCGYYNNSIGDYAWFAGSETPTSEMFANFSFTNNTIYDSPKMALISNRNKNLAWDENTKWNIRIENNTFINFSTRYASKYMISLRYMPVGSYISLQRNLFVLAADEADQRALYSCGADIRSTDFSFDVKDNYSVGCRDSHLRNDGIFTAGAFSASRNSFSNGINNGTAEDLIVKVGSTPLKATDLFTNPNPPYTAHDPAAPNELDHAAPDNIFEALRYRQTPEVLSHEIYTLSIGDPRWRN